MFSNNKNDDRKGLRSSLRVGDVLSVTRRGRTFQVFKKDCDDGTMSNINNSKVVSTITKRKAVETNCSILLKKISKDGNFLWEFV